MKNLYNYLVLFLFIIVSCQKADRVSEVEEPQMFSLTERSCASNEVLEQQLASDPALRTRMEQIEEFTRNYLKNARTSTERATITIPVVVHVVYNTSTQNIHDLQVQSQIDVMNEDFNLENADHTKVPGEFEDEKSNVNIRFVLDRTIRVKTTKKSFGTDDGVKYTKRGGSDVVEPSKYLNLWVCNLGQNLLGYAQFPGGNPATDGIVVLYSATGSKDKYPNGVYVNNYNLGRTATHEIGHWINLRHIWGDATCGTDYVDDTPVHNTSNGGCPPADHRSTCTGTPLEMWMNYMDYTYDQCMYMFSNGQKLRADAVFAAGGPRASMARK